MAKALEKHGDKIRFVIVGGANTALDFLVLFLFVNLGVDKIVANYISTSVALIFSFFANKSFTFKNTDKNDSIPFLCRTGFEGDFIQCLYKEALFTLNKFLLNFILIFSKF